MLCAVDSTTTCEKSSKTFVRKLTCLIAIPQDAHVILSHQLASLAGIVGVENGPHHGHGCLERLDVRQGVMRTKD